MYFYLLNICKFAPFAFPYSEGGNRRLTEGFPMLPITYYLKLETPQSLRDSSPISGAKWLPLNCAFKYNKQVICRFAPFTFPNREGGNQRLSEGFPILTITYYILFIT